MFGSLGDRPAIQNYIVIITDGRSNDRAETWEQALLAREDGIHIITLGVGEGVRPDELRGIASFPTESNMLTVDSFESLNDVSQTLTQAICNSMILYLQIIYSILI